jgi:hypothetical protein
MLIASIIAVSSLTPSRSFAAHHLWRFTQLFSNAAGDIQFLEMFVTANGESAVGPFTITSGGTTFSFVNNLPSTTTANTWLLVGTNEYRNSAGATAPDYVLPPNFLSTGGGTINYASGIDTWNYGALPTDGVHSLMKDGTNPVNLAHNFAGQTGTVNVSTSVPAVGGWAVVALIGTLLLLTSGLLRKQAATLT